MSNIHLARMFSIFRMGLLDFDVAAVTDSSLGDGAWDCVVLVCENLDWPNFKNSFAHIKPAIEDANKVVITSFYVLKK